MLTTRETTNKTKHDFMFKETVINIISNYYRNTNTEKPPFFPSDLIPIIVSYSLNVIIFDIYNHEYINMKHNKHNTIITNKKKKHLNYLQPRKYQYITLVCSNPIKKYDNIKMKFQMIKSTLHNPIAFGIVNDKFKRMENVTSNSPYWALYAFGSSRKNVFFWGNYGYLKKYQNEKHFQKNDTIEIDYNQNNELIWKKNKNSKYVLDAKKLLKNHKYYFMVSFTTDLTTYRIELI